MCLPGWPPYTENAYHTIPYIKCVGKCLSYNFHTISKNGWKLVLTHFCGCLILIKQSGDKKLRFSFFEKKCLSYNSHIWKLYDWHFFDGDTKNFSSSFENLAQKFFVFFSTANRFSSANKQFSKKKICMQNIIFCVHNVVLDTIKLA